MDGDTIMDFDKMVKEKQSALQLRIRRESRTLQNLVTPITDILDGQRIKHSIKFLCKSDKVPYKVSIDARKPKLTVNVSIHGYTIREGSSQWTYKYRDDINLGEAIEDLAEVIARSRVKTPCRK